MVTKLVRRKPRAKVKAKAKRSLFKGCYFTTNTAAGALRTAKSIGKRPDVSTTVPKRSTKAALRKGKLA